MPTKAKSTSTTRTKRAVKQRGAACATDSEADLLAARVAQIMPVLRAIRKGVAIAVTSLDSAQCDPHDPLWINLAASMVYHELLTQGYLRD